MAQRKIPMRKDIVTGEMKPKKELVRVVKNKENEVSIDPTGKKAGRGAYIHLNDVNGSSTVWRNSFSDHFMLYFLPMQQI